MRAAIGLSITIMLLLLLYGGGYCLMLRSRYINARDYITPCYRFVGAREYDYGSIYEKAVTAFFFPANAIDRQVRPSEWQVRQSVLKSPVSAEATSDL